MTGGHSAAFKDFTAALAGIFNGLVGTVLNSLLIAAQGVCEFFGCIEQGPCRQPTRHSRRPLSDPDRRRTEGNPQVNRSMIELRRLAPEIYALLDLVPIAQDLVNNINQMKSLSAPNGGFDAAKVALNLPGIASALSQSCKDLIALQQGLGLFGLTITLPSVPALAPDLVTTAQNLQGS